MPTVTLHINDATDGDRRRRPKTDDFTQTDDYWLQRLGEKWAIHQGKPMDGTSYRIDKLPYGFVGYEKRRAGGDSKHVDRYVYGHHKGPARSMPDFFPHFLHLMEQGTAEGCTCKLCTGGSRQSGGGGKVGDGASVRSGSPAGQQSQYFARPKALVPKTQSTVPQPKPIGRPRTLPVPQKPKEDDAPPQRRKQVDEEGTPDALRALIDKLMAAGQEGRVDESLVENMSPDWRAGHAAQMKALKEWAALPGYVPRQGELVLFVRNLGVHEALGWDNSAKTWRVVDAQNEAWLERPKWEAGVITQMPKEPLTDADLEGVPEGKRLGVVEAGFRTEPLPQPNSVNKPLTKQHKYVPLHAIRPLALWKDCMNGVPDVDRHPTIGHALSVASSFCVQGKYHFKGIWPEATIFAQGIYIGAELISVGDAVCLQRRGAAEMVTDVMIITAIKVRIVNLDEASDDDYDDGHPYNTCTHISGRTYTQDPTRSYDGIGKQPIQPNSNLLPPGLQELGTWYHITDPRKPKARIEVPFQRVLGRCYESAALKAWYTSPCNIVPPSTGFQAVNQPKPEIKLNDKTMPLASSELSHGAAGIVEARKYSQGHDIRIDIAGGKTWFWADTRVQQLDLHEVNGTYVGVKDTTRSKEQLADWRKALKALDGKQGGLEEYHAARREREEAQARRESVLGASTSGLVAGGAQAVAEPATQAEESSGTSPEGDEEEDGDGMNVDEAPAAKFVRATEAMEIDDDEDEEDDGEGAGNALAAFKAAQPASGARAGGAEVIMLDDDSD